MPSNKYPFEPKSSTKLIPGDFWSIPLKNGSFGCGVVIEHLPNDKLGAKVGFLGGLLHWQGQYPPQVHDLSNSKFIAQGVMHIRAIKNSSKLIIGNTAECGLIIEPWLFINGSIIQKGFTPIRNWTKEDNATIPTLGYWGYDFIQTLANKHLVTN